MDQSDVLGLVSRLYEAVAVTELWGAVISEISASTGSLGAILHFRSEPHPGWGRQIIRGMDPAYEASFRQHYCTVDPIFPCLISEGRGVHCVSEVIDQRELERTEWYGEWWAPQGCGDAMIICSEVSITGLTGLSLARTRTSGTFDREQLRLADTLLPHLSAALTLESKFTAARRYGLALDDLIDRFDTGVIVLDQNGRVLRVNPIALSIVRKRDGLSIVRGMVRAEHPASHRELTRRIDHAARGSIDGSGWVSIERPSGDGPFVVLVCPARPIAAEVIPDQACAFLLIRDSGSIAPALERTIEQVWHMTAAQAQVVALLIELGRVEDVAERLRVKRGTVHAHLKQAYAVTGTRGQAELVSLVLRTVGHAGPDTADWCTGHSR